MRNDRFEWDDEKARRNLAKHGVSFEEAALVFDDPNALLEIDDAHPHEDRWRTTGLGEGRLLIVVSTERADDIIRIISARPADRREKNRYQG